MFSNQIETISCYLVDMLLHLKGSILWFFFLVKTKRLKKCQNYNPNWLQEKSQGTGGQTNCEKIALETSDTWSMRWLSHQPSILC